MSRFAPSPRPSSSLWGAVQQADCLAPGIWQVMTASHGGILLSEERQAAMPEALALAGPAYEEDCDWALAILGFEDELRADGALSPGMLQLARDTVRCWHPDRYERHTGEAVPEKVSHVVRRRNACLAAIGRHSVTSAWGAWADWVPEGKCGVVARKLAGVDHLGRAQYTDNEICALVPAEIYRARGEVFVLEDHPHEIIAFPASLRPKQVSL